MFAPKFTNHLCEVIFNAITKSNIKFFEDYVSSQTSEALTVQMYKAGEVLPFSTLLAAKLNSADKERIASSIHKWFKDNGYDINRDNGDGTVLTHAVGACDLAVMKQAFNFGARVNKKEAAELIDSAIENNPDDPELRSVMSLLAEHGSELPEVACGTRTGSAGSNASSVSAASGGAYPLRDAGMAAKEITAKEITAKEITAFVATGVLRV